MDILLALVVGGLGLGLVIFFAEQLVKGVIGTSMGFGLSAFLLAQSAGLGARARAQERLTSPAEELLM